MQDKVVLYVTVPHCARCIGLERALKAANIEYEINENLEDVFRAGYKTAPMLKVDNDFLMFEVAQKWIFEHKK